MPNNNNAKKFTTNIVAVNAVNSEGAQYLYAGITGIVSRIEAKICNTKDGSQHQVVDASICVNKRNYRLNSLLGTKFPVSTRENPVKEETWVDLRFWDKSAESLIKYLNAAGVPTNGTGKILLAVFGALKSSQYTDRNGQERVGVSMKGYEFWSMPRGNSNGNNAQNGAAQAQDNVPAMNANGGYDDTSEDNVPAMNANGGYDDTSDFDLLSADDEGDVPF